MQANQSSATEIFEQSSSNHIVHGSQSPLQLQQPQTLSSLIHPPKLNDRYLNAVGLLRVNWKNSQGELISLSYGTAFAVNCRTLLTCSHNIYSLKNHLCSEVIFVPGMSVGRVDNRYKLFKVSKIQHFAYSKPRHSFIKEPTKQQLSMVILQGQLDLDYFMPIGSLQNQNSPQTLQIIGYPSRSYQNTVDLSQASINRTSLQGNLVQIDNFMIKHNMATECGQSGSPIVAFGDNQVPYIVGIHTHLGLDDSYNVGVYFTKQNLQTLKDYQNRLCNATMIQKINIFKNKAKFNFFQRVHYQPNEDYDSDYLYKLFQDSIELHQLSQWKQTNQDLQSHRLSIGQDENYDTLSEESSIDEDLIKSNLNSNEYQCEQLLNFGHGQAQDPQARINSQKVFQNATQTSRTIVRNNIPDQY